MSWSDCVVYIAVLMISPLSIFIIMKYGNKTDWNRPNKNNHYGDISGREV
jgi:hypothetical protein